ncbi:MAG TPA: carbon-nitrogen hydrolase family protein [Verrucomicrobiae bacterium]|nr:carbon-nitrogen hydrolase family protein [Verrucomicrobiae bacterium]
MTAARIAVAQMAASEDKAINRDVVTRLCTRAGEGGAALCILPEESMVSLYSGAQPADTAEPLGGPFVSLLGALAAKYGMVIVAGIHESATEGARAYNTIVVVGSTGQVTHRYHKIHLYDAFGYRESEQIIPGSGPLVTFDVAPFRLGVLNCYDLRFPELTRVLVDAGADVLVVPAAWQAGRLKEDHWRTLVRARAIENSSWVLAAGQSGDHCIGQSMIVDPLGIVRGQLGEEREGVLIEEIDTERLALARRLLPGLQQRRFRVDHQVRPIGEGAGPSAAAPTATFDRPIETTVR